MTTTKKSLNTVVKYQWDIPVASLETTGLENQTKLQTFPPPLPSPLTKRAS